MNYLLDVNVLVAWGWEDHEHHERVVNWIAARKKSRRDKLLTSAIPELGFVRVSILQSQGQVGAEQAVTVLRGMLETLGKRAVFVGDEVSSTEPLHDWCQRAKRTTDSHLLKLAERLEAKLATLDQGIPGAFVLP
ncbi:MAG: PIN domain-containing protein [Verrucomicrobiota bacterium]